ncbi:FHA domain-containing protein [Rhodopirellula sallentina]|uniref:Forkhead-associated domain protein n=1 Tax=Rhodopirellula sallentina SM41 TaxID=1263870 RepID=M5UC09_9BACT|nr:FHA domain-containing protein [Rhodopirellula sallentina]EMI53538.1 Forkhead-associated domain protein [Rhodopirellula sallentina SM41]
MNDRQWIIGCDRDVDVLVRESVVSRRHCRLSLHGGRYFIEDLASRNGTFVGKKRIVTRTAIDPGTKVMLADSVVMPWPDESLAKEQLRIGRSDANDVVIDDASVSAQHAVLLRDPNDVWVVRDLNSTNGVSLDDSEPINSAARVTAEDVIRFGSVAETLSSLRRNVVAKPVAVAAGSGASDSDLAPPSGDTDTKPRPKSGARSFGETTTSARQPTPMETARQLWRSTPPAISYSLIAAAVLLLVLGMWAFRGGDAESVASGSPGDNAIIGNDPNELSPEGGADLGDGQAGANLGTTNQSNNSGEPTSDPPSSPSKSQSGSVSATASSSGSSASGSNSSATANIESAIRDCLYQVVADSEGNRFALGLALAIDSHRLLTTGNIVENLQELDASIVPACQHLAGDDVIVLEASAMHPKWMETRRLEQQYIEWLKQYREQMDELAQSDDPESKELLKQRDTVFRSALAARMLARAYDVGVIRSEEPLPRCLSALQADATGKQNAGAVSALEWVATPSKSPRPMATHRLIGAFEPAEDPYLEPESPLTIREKQVQALFLLPRLTTDMPPISVAKIRGESNGELDFSGGVILDRRGRLAGLYSMPTQLDEQQRQRVESLVSDDDLTFDWISIEVLSQLMASPSLPWVANQTTNTSSP